MSESKIREFTDLIVWQKSHALTIKIYKITASFPTEERFGLISQMRRAAYSVPANIVEGFTRQGTRSKLQFYNISQGSLEELRYFMILAKDLGYVENIDGLLQDYSEVAKLLKGFINSIKEKNKRPDR